MTDEQQDSFEYLGVTIRPCVREQSLDVGDCWYISSVNQFTREEDDEDSCLRYRLRESAMRAVDSLIEMEERPPWTAQTPT